MNCFLTLGKDCTQKALNMLTTELNIVKSWASRLQEYLDGWGKSVVVGRAKLGGVKTSASEQHV